MRLPIYDGSNISTWRIIRENGTFIFCMFLDMPSYIKFHMMHAYYFCILLQKPVLLTCCLSSFSYYLPV